MPVSHSTIGNRGCADLIEIYVRRLPRAAKCCWQAVVDLRSDPSTTLDTFIHLLNLSLEYMIDVLRL